MVWSHSAIPVQVVEWKPAATVVNSPRALGQGGAAIEGLTTELCQVACRVVQEGVSNAVRHSAASHAWVIVRLHRDDVFITVRDDGAGVADLEPGNGLSGMRERVESIGGTLSWESVPGGGFTLSARMPANP